MPAKPEEHNKGEAAPRVSLDALEAFGENGEEIKRFEGPKQGPTIFIIGGMHGNELAGTIVVYELLQALQNKTLNLVSGKVVLALGNPHAIARNNRYAESGIEMNQLFTEDIITREDERWEARRAQRLAREIDAADIVIDIHATTKPSVPFVVAPADERHADIYKWFPRAATLEDPNHLMAGRIAMASEYANHKGKIGIVFEAGEATDTDAAKYARQGILSILADRKLIDEQLSVRPYDAPVFTLKKSVIFEEGFRFANEDAIEGFTPVKKGEVFAFINDLPLVAEYDCYIVLAFLPQYRQPGRAVCYLAVKKDE